MDCIGFGIIGLGHWGPNHLRVVSQLPGCNVFAVSDLDSQSLDKVTRNHPTLATMSRYEDLLLRDDIHAVIVSTPTKTHTSIVRDALKAGKHVLCEKPLCTDSSEGHELVELAASLGKILMVGHVFLFNNGLEAVRKMVHAGEVGDLRYLASTRTNLGPVRSDVNAAWDLASHDIAIFNWITGNTPIEVKAMGAAFLQSGIEDIVDISLRYPDNVVASLRCSWLDPKKVRQLTVVGSRKMITWDDLALNNPVAVYEKTFETRYEANTFGEFLRLSMHEGDVRLPKIHLGEPLRLQAEEFVSAIRSKRTPLSDGSFALGVVETLERVSLALRTSGC